MRQLVLFIKAVVRVSNSFVQCFLNLDFSQC